MKKVLLITTFSLLATISYSQNRILNWATQTGGVGIDQGYSIAVDASGNIYSAGIFEDTVDFDPSSGVHNLISNGNKDIFIQKLDQNGSFLWAKSIGGIGRDEVRDISIDLNGNLLITGFFEDTVDFDPSSGISNLISNGFLDIFILKLDASGNFIWAISYGGTNVTNGFDDDRAYSINSDKNGDIILSGRFTGTLDFNPDTAVYSLTSNGYQDIFIQKLDSNGNFIWAIAMGSSYVGDEARCMTIDSRGNIYTAGAFGINTDFDPDTGVVNLQPSTGFCIFILKLSPQGKFIWARGIVNGHDERSFQVVTDLNDNVYTTGYFNSTLDFNPDSAGVFNMRSKGAEDIFIQKLDSSGNFLWAKSMGSTGDDEGFALAIDDSNNVYTSGYFEGTVNFNTDSAGVFNLTSNGTADIFIQKMDEDGNFIWAESFGGTGFDQTRSMLVDEKGSIFTTGFFESTVDFDPDTTNSFNLSSNGGNDQFILKLGQCFNSFDTLNINSCTNYTSPSGKLWTISGTYLDTIQNSTGCDSLLSINLTITTIDTTITLVNNVKITANDSLANYQWIDCNNGNAPIVGDTNRSFIATANGSYAVVLSNNGCVDTSGCVPIFSVGVTEPNTKQAAINFYPNPNNGNFTLEVGKDLITKRFQIYDAKGSLLIDNNIQTNRTPIDLSAYGEGIYFLKIRAVGESEKVVVVD